MSDEKPPQKVTYLGQVDYRNKSLTFGIKENDRTRHMYIIGKTGMGKSTLLENMAVQDIRNGEGLCVIDPHGSFAEKLLEYVPENRVNDVIYFAPFDTDHPMGLNVLEKVDISKRHLVANGLMSAFKKIFGEERFSDRIQYILNNIILALLENENESLLGVNRMLIDKDYRKFIISNVKDPSVRSFWLEEFVKAGDKYQQEAAPGIQNKIGQFISNPLIRNIIGQQRTSFDVREIMDNKKILIVNLSKGKVGEGNANLIGSLLITKIYLAAMSRADAGVHELEKLPPFYFYVDEFQNFANESFANILSEARKYNLALTVAHQYVEQMTDEVKAAVFGNVGSMVVFRVGATDAEIFEKEFAPYFILDDIVNLGFTQIYLRLMIDGVGSKPFSAKTLGPIKRPSEAFVQEIISNTREHYAKKVGDAEEEIRNWYEPRVAPPKIEAKTGDALATPAKGEVETLSRERKVEQVPERRREVRGDEGRRGEPGVEKRKTNSSPVTRYDTNNSEKEISTVNTHSTHVSETKKVEESKAPHTKKEVTEMGMGVKEKAEEVVEVVIAKVENVERENAKEYTHKESHVKRGDRNYSPHPEKEGGKGNSLKDALLKAMEEKKREDKQKEEIKRGKELLSQVEKNPSNGTGVQSGQIGQRDKDEERAGAGNTARSSPPPAEISEDILKPLIEETPL
jgi:hypothetical protein